MVYSPRSFNILKIEGLYNTNPVEFLALPKTPGPKSARDGGFWAALQHFPQAYILKCLEALDSVRGVYG
jgi:hypothetical protein